MDDVEGMDSRSDVVERPVYDIETVNVMQNDIQDFKGGLLGIGVLGIGIYFENI